MILILSIAAIIWIGFFVQIFMGNSVDNEYYIFSEIGECDKLIPFDKANIKVERYDNPRKDKDLNNLTHDKFFAMNYESESLQYEIFAYEFVDADSALKYYVNATGQKSYEKKLSLSNSDENNLLSSSTGMFSYRLVVVHKNMVYQVTAPKQYKTELSDLLSVTFSTKMEFVKK